MCRRMCRRRCGVPSRYLTFSPAQLRQSVVLGVGPPGQRQQMRSIWAWRPKWVIRERRWGWEIALGAGPQLARWLTRAQYSQTARRRSAWYCSARSARSARSQAALEAAELILVRLNLGSLASVFGCMQAIVAIPRPGGTRVS